MTRWEVLFVVFRNFFLISAKIPSEMKMTQEERQLILKSLPDILESEREIFENIILNHNVKNR